MAYSFAPIQAFSTPICTSSSRRNTKLNYQKIRASNQDKSVSVHRRNITLGLVGAALSLTNFEQSAKAAGKRAPPPPPQEKKDLSMTGLQAKVMASKKRREAMKEEVARLREMGKDVTNPSE